MKKARWYTLGFLTAKVKYCLFTDEKLFKKSYKKVCKLYDVDGVKPSFVLNERANASTHAITNGEGSVISFICIDLSNKSISNEQIVSLLVHEVVHVWQYIKEEMGNGNVGREFEAYNVQQITQDLLQELSKRLDERRGTNDNLR